MEPSAALAVGLSIGIIAALLMVAAWCLKGKKTESANNTGEKRDNEESEQTESEVHAESVELEAIQSNEPDIEQEILEQQVQDEEEDDEEEAPPPEKLVLTTLDVHTCSSQTCEVCRKQQTPTFVSAIRMPPGMQGRIRSLPDRWWEKNYDSDAIATMMAVGPAPVSTRTKRVRSEHSSRRYHDIVKEYPEDEL